MRAVEWTPITALFIGAIAFSMSCGSTPPKPQPPQIDVEPGPTQGGTDVEPPPQVEPPLVQVRASGVDETQAYERALAELASAMYGDPAWADIIDASLHDPQRDIIEHAEGPSDGVQITLGLEFARVEEIFDQAETRPWDMNVAAPLADILNEVRDLQVQSLICKRRQVLLGEECLLQQDGPDNGLPPSDVEGTAGTNGADGDPAVAGNGPDLPAERASKLMRQLASEITLRPRFIDGIPLTAKGQPLRSVILIAERVTGEVRQRLTDVPFVAELPAGQGPLLAIDATVTDDIGVLEFPLMPEARWPTGGIRIALDRDALLGPLASMWPPIEIVVSGRETSPERWAVITTERVQGRVTNDGLFNKSFDMSMTSGGAQQGAEITAGDRQRLLAAMTGDSTTQLSLLSELADTWAGRIDTLVAVELDSEYASRMGAHRLWYEARGQAMVFDVWTGKRIAVIEEAAMASGIGDDRADRAARTELADKIAKRVLLTETP